MTLDALDWTSPRDRRVAVAPGAPVLAELNAAGWIAAADVHVATRVRRLLGEDDPAVLAALALTVRAAREGGACLDLADAHASLSGGRAGEPGGRPHTPVLAVDETPAADDAPIREGTLLPSVAPGDAPAATPSDAATAPTWLPATAAAWAAAVAASGSAAAGVLRVEDDLVYLDRYHREERQVADDLRARLGLAVPAVDEASLAAGLERVFVGESWAEQRVAVAAAAARSTTVLVGGPGTGKTSTVAGLLTLLLEQAPPGVGVPRIALAAPSGKAAARLGESVRESLAGMPAADRDRIGAVESSTLHRLLGWDPQSRNRFRHRRSNPLPHDIVVVDEASMLSLTLMARLLEALRDSARLILVGDPDQLVSVEAGAVLADLVVGFESWGPASPVARLGTAHRFGREIGALADAVRLGDADRVMALLRAGGPALAYVEVDDVAAAHEALDGSLLDHGGRLREFALAGDVSGALAALREHRLLCAHRDGPWGVATWNARVERLLRESDGSRVDPRAGRPLLVTANDYRLGLANGDTGIVVRRDDRWVAVFGEPSAPVAHGATALADVDTAYAMTIHKSQGSQADEITVLLPEDGSRLLTRELLYTAVTRAQRHLVVAGSEAAVRRAVTTRTHRATGLHRRLALPTDASLGRTR